MSIHLLRIGSDNPAEALIHMDSCAFECEPLPGGITNENFVLKMHGLPVYVMRVSGANVEHLGINRKNEFINISEAVRLEIAPKTVYWNDKAGIMVSQYVQGPTLGEIKIRARRRRLGVLARLLRKLHASKANFKGRVTLESAMLSNAKSAETNRARVPQEASNALKHALRLCGMLKYSKKPRWSMAPAPSHLDLMPGNVIFENKNKAWLVDWEYSGMADPFFDLALVSLLNDFDMNMDNRLLAHYLGRSPNSLAKLWFYTYKAGLGVREAFWGIVQTAVSKLDFNFKKYAQTQIGRYDKARRALEQLKK